MDEIKILAGVFPIAVPGIVGLGKIKTGIIKYTYI